MATDTAFALAVLAIAGRRMPVQARVFLLTLAVVDDLGAIVATAVFYTSAVAFVPLAGAVGVCGLYALAQRQRVRPPWIYLLLGVTAWAFCTASGVHATVAGVALGLLTRVRPGPGEDRRPAERWQDAIEPLSAGVCVPVFASSIVAAALATGSLHLRARGRDNHAD